ncbi:MAG TPA: hypothetical protein GX509_04340 [Firmicutes bacterium]|nr:hypothetical protein [Bacillota bacterium]HHY97950.1 hypothetical protein [Bacillota bacterium]
MLCDRCKQRPANVHVTKVIDGRKTEMHLCEGCARETGQFQFFTMPEFSFHNVLAGLFDPESTSGSMPPVSSAPVARKCPTCGTDFGDFKRTGFLGCSDCYQQFQNRLEPILRRVHGSTRHVGKVPARTGGAVRIKKEIESLRKQLEAAIAREEYEKAAEIRDKIRELDRKIDGRSREAGI